jgi:hypothetical protein
VQLPPLLDDAGEGLVTILEQQVPELLLTDPAATAMRTHLETVSRVRLLSWVPGD